MRNGFLAVVGGVPLFEVEQALLPGTVNTTGQMMFPNDTIIIAGRPGSAYAPIYTGFAEGSPLVVEMNPRETGDMSIYIWGYRSQEGQLHNSVGLDGFLPGRGLQLGYPALCRHTIYYRL